MVSLTAEQGQFSGFITAGGNHYNLMQSQEENFIYQSQTSQIPQPARDYIIPPKKLGEEAPVTTTSSDNFIDLVIGYTAEAAGNTDIETTIQSLVAGTNQMLADSCANFRYRLLSTVATGVSTGSQDGSTILTAMQAEGGTYSMLHTERDNVGADLIHLFVDTNSIGLCGIAYLGQVGFFDEDFGLGLTLYGCPDYVLAHELGHNLSLTHDRYEQSLDINDSSASLGEHYGYVDMVNRFESIMSYPNHCQAVGVSCERLNKYSNPNIYHNGVPFGIDELANGVDGMNEAFPFVANYRTSQTSFDPGISENCATSNANTDLHCFIATATFGSSLHPKIKILRDFRDQWLNKSALGRSLVKLYYKTSPHLAIKIQNSSFLKSLFRPLISGLIFLIQHPSLFLIAFLCLFVSKPFLLLVFAFSFLSIPAQGQITIQPKDYVDAPLNPSLNFIGSSSYLLGVNAKMIDLSGSPNSTATYKDSGTELGLLLAYREADLFFDFRYTPEWERSLKLTQIPFAESSTKEKTSAFSLAFGFKTLLMPLGFLIEQESVKLINENELESASIDTLSLNFGSKFDFSGILLGGGLIFSQIGKDDKLASQSVSANRLSLYASLGYAGGAGASEGAGGSAGAVQAELGYRRDPEVVALDGAADLVLPEQAEISLFLQYGWSQWFTNLRYSSISQQSVDNFFTDSNDISEYRLGVGYEGLGWVLTFYPAYQSESGGFQRTGLILGANLLFTFGGGSFGGGGGGGEF